MKLAAMFRDVAAALTQPPVTQLYPFERTDAPARLRGKLTWQADKCTGCGLCIKDCPADAINFVVNDKKAKIFVMEYYADRCIYCAQCTQNCRFNFLAMSNTDWELAALTRAPFHEYWGQPEHVQAYLDSLAEKPEAPLSVDTDAPATVEAEPDAS